MDTGYEVQGVIMIKSNETKLLKVIARMSIANQKFMNEYGIKCEKSKEMMKKFTETDTEPTSEELDEANAVSIQEFTEQLSSLLEKDMPEKFFIELFAECDSIVL